MNELRVKTHGVEVAVWEAGSGHPLLVLHGLGLDHVGVSDELEPIFDGASPWRRIYLDLPGMGRTPGSVDLANADALLDVVVGVVADRIGENRFALLGQSYGGYLALGVLERLGERISGLALVIPVVEPKDELRVLPDPVKLRRHEAMATLPSGFLEGFRGLIVDETPELAADLLRSWVPSMGLSDQAYLDLLRREGYSFSRIDPTALSFSGPSLVLCGRHDAVVGYEQAMSLLPLLDRGTLAVLDGAGHLAQLEKPGLVRALIRDWLLRLESEEGL